MREDPLQTQVGADAVDGGLWDGRPFTALTAALEDELIAEHRRSLVDELMAVIGRTQPEPHDRARLELAREILRGFLLVECPAKQLRITPNDGLRELPILDQRATYWNELDEIAQWARAQVIRLAQARILGAAESLSDPVASILHLRQLIELVFWAAFYQYGQTIAYNLLRKQQSELRDKFLLCRELEAFIRAAGTMSDRRLADAWNAVGLDGPSPTAEDQVAEIQTALVKQRAVVRFVAQQAVARGEVGLLEHVDRLRAAYGWACGFVHVTPQLLLWTDPISTEKFEQEAGFTIASAILSCLTVLARLVLADELAGVRFGPMFARPSAQVREIAERPLPELEMLVHRRRKVVFTMHDGEEIVVYDPNAG